MNDSLTTSGPSSRPPASQPPDQASWSDPGEQFLQRVRRATINVLGDSPVGRAVLELCDDHAEARRMILQDRSGGATVVAVVGATGQGKSWLMRQLVRNSTAARAIASGNRPQEATEKLLWVGPRPPADLDPRHEKFLPCEASKMQPIGASYLLVDAPGATDDRRAIAAVASRALSLASVLLLVVRHDQLRSQTVGMLAEASEGSLVVPVINAVRKQEESLSADLDTLAGRIRAAAPSSVVVDPVIVEDFEVQGRSEADVGRAAAESVAERLQSEIGGSWEGDPRQSTRLGALDARFRAALHSILSDHLPDLTVAVQRLNQEARALPAEVAETLVGSGGPLRAAVRSRLRLSLLTDTAAIWFPYRSQLGLLNLTHGAWDRVLMSLSGSLPSLVGAVWAGARNVSHQHSSEAEIRDGLRKRSAAAVADRLSPLTQRFREELIALRHEDRTVGGADEDPRRTHPASLAGVDALQEASQRILDEAVDRESISRSAAILCGIAGTALFWGLMSGPIVALYRGYFDASYATLRELAGDLQSFPRPDLSMLLTSLLLSLLPTALFAMWVLSVAQSRGRVDRTESRIRQQHHETITRLQNDGVLRLQWNDPLLSDAEFLLSAGAAEPTALRS